MAHLANDGTRRRRDRVTFLLNADEAAAWNRHVASETPAGEDPKRFGSRVFRDMLRKCNILGPTPRKIAKKI